MRYYLPMLFLLVIGACNSKPSPKAVLAGALQPDTIKIYQHGDTLQPVTALSGDLENTLKMYAYKNSFELVIGDFIDAAYIKIFRLNGCKFAIISDSCFRIYKLDNTRLTLLAKENRPMPFQRFVCADVDFDKLDDVILYNNCGSINYDTKALIFNPALKTLEHKPQFDIPNLEIDTVSQLLRGYLVPHSIYGGYQKSIYKVVNDSVQLFRTVLLYNSPVGKSNKLQSTLVTQTITNGATITDSLVIPQTKGDKIFNQTLWNSYKQFHDPL